MMSIAAGTPTIAKTPTTAGTAESLESPLAEKTSTAVGMGQQQRLKPQQGLLRHQEQEEQQQQQGHQQQHRSLQQLGPRKANGNNNIGYIRVSSNSRGRSNTVGPLATADSQATLPIGRPQ